MDAYQRQRLIEELRKKEGLAPAEPVTPVEQPEEDDGDALISKETAEKLEKAKVLAKGGALKVWGLTKDASFKVKEKAEALAEKGKEKAQARAEQRRVKEDPSPAPHVEVLHQGPTREPEAPTVYVPPVIEPECPRVVETTSSQEVQGSQDTSAKEFLPVRKPDQAPTPTRFQIPALPIKPLLIGAGAVALVAVLAFVFMTRDTAPVVPVMETEKVLPVAPSIKSPPVAIPPAVTEVVDEVKDEEGVVEPEVVTQVEEQAEPEPTPVATSTEPVVEATKTIPVAVEAPKTQPATVGAVNKQKKPQTMPAKNRDEPKEESWQDKANRDIDAWGENL